MLKLKLEAKLLLSVSVIQTIFKEIQEIHIESDIDTQMFESNPLSISSRRTKQSYQQHVEDQRANNTTSVGDIKFDSVFNQLCYIQVCQPGLPPCLGHDIFEGIVSSDIALYINHLVDQEKHFTYAQLI